MMSALALAAVLPGCGEERAPTPSRGELVGRAEGADAASSGQFDPVFDLPVEVAHAHVLPTGKVLFYSYTDAPYVWSPATGSLRMMSRLPRWPGTRSTRRETTDSHVRYCRHRPM